MNIGILLSENYHIRESRILLSNGSVHASKLEKQNVIVNNTESNIGFVTIGVPQGSNRVIRDSFLYT